MISVSKRGAKLAPLFFLLFSFCAKAHTVIVKIKNTEVKADLANTNVTRELGLMNRKTLAADAGMLFVFDNEAQQSFWMKNTYISLDMIFISAQKEIVYIEHATTPLSESAITPNVLAKYILEVNSGYAEAHGIGVGEKVDF